METLSLTNLVERIGRLEKIAEDRAGLSENLSQVQEAVHELERIVQDPKRCSAAVLDGLNTVLETIKIMQGEHSWHMHKESIANKP